MNFSHFEESDAELAERNPQTYHAEVWHGRSTLKRAGFNTRYLGTSG